MKKKIILASLISVIGLFLIAGTITLASTTATTNSEPKTAATTERNNTYCQRENHKMSDGNFYCDGEKKGYHNENCDYYDENMTTNNNSKSNNNCHNGQNGRGNGRHHMNRFNN